MFTQPEDICLGHGVFLDHVAAGITRRRMPGTILSYTVVIIVLYLAIIAAAASAQPVDVAPGADIPALINSGTYNMVLTGDATWNSALDINSVARSSLSIDGQGNTITVLANGINMLPNFSVDSNVSLTNIKFSPSAPYTSRNNYLFGFATANRTSNLNLSGSSFTGFNRSQDKGANIIWTDAAGATITIDGGVDGVVFKDNRAEWDSAGAVAINRSNVTFTGLVNFENNWSGNYGGAVTVYENNPTLTFAGTTNFTGNHSVVFGGAIDVWGGQQTVIFDGVTTFDGNYTHYVQGTDYDSPRHVTDQHTRGGAMNIGYIASTGNGTLVTFNNQVTFSNNYALSEGTQANNRNALGGAVSVFGNNEARNYRLFFNEAAIFENNYVYAVNGTGNGGAIYYDSTAAQLTISSGSRFSGNYAKTYGGAIYLQRGDITLSALTGDIVFEGNRQGADFQASGSTYVPVDGSGVPNAIYLGTGGTLTLNAGAGYAIRFNDPIASVAGSSVTVNKGGDGEVIFTGDNGATSLYDSDLQASTNVIGGYFTLANGVKYGSTTAGSFTVQSGATARGGDTAALRAGNVVVQTGGTLGVQGGLFTLDSASIALQTASILTGNGTLAATSDIILGGVVTANIAVNNTLAVTGLLTNVGGIDKTGAGTLVLAAANTYTGTTTVSAGILAAGVDNAFAQSSSVTVNAGATLDLKGYDQLAQNLSGDGDIDLGAATLTAQTNGSNVFTGDISGSGKLVKTGTGQLTLSGDSTYGGGTTVSAGTLTATGGSSLGTGTVTVANNATLEFNFTGDETAVNQLGGMGTILKTGAGIARLTSNASSTGTVIVRAGTLSLEQDGIFRATGYTTESGATTAIGEDARLVVTGAFTQQAGSYLDVVIGDNEPAVSAISATITGSTLEVTGFDTGIMATASRFLGNTYTVISTTTGITGDFADVIVGSNGTAVDFLTVTGEKTSDNLSYVIGVGLTWFAGPQEGNGIFTLTNAGDSFSVDVNLDDRASSATGWSGRDLTKRGLGTLSLAAANDYTGATRVEAGTLATAVANAFAASSSVYVAAGGTLALNGFSQIAQNLSGGGAITLGNGNAVLTVQNATGNSSSFSGVISGAGSVELDGGGTLTLSGQNTYTGGTAVTDGILVATNGGALGSGDANVAVDGELLLSFAGDETVANKLGGEGSLTMNGSGIARLVAAGSSIGAVTVASGELSLEQTGLFTAASYTTASGATTNIAEDSRLAVTGAFTQAAGSTLSVAIGNNLPVITAATANITGSNLDVTGIDAQSYGKASQFNNTAFTIISTTGGITGDFASIDLGTTLDPVDYLIIDGRKSVDNRTYDVYFGLTWFSGATTGDGVFTLADATDSFEVDIALNNQTGSFASLWDGATLTKAGDGTLILSAVNTYSGDTRITGGTLRTDVANAFAASSAVSVSAGATLDMNGNSQTARNLAGAGAIALGGANTILTVQNTGATEFSGEINGAGSVALTGGGQLTLSGTNTYTGGTAVNNGVMVATHGGAIGTGAASVATGSELRLAFSGDETFDNAFSGAGTLAMTGSGTARVSAAGSSIGAVDVRSGVLSLEQTGVITAGTYRTQANATTALDQNARLVVTGAFTQAANSTLAIAIGNNQPTITAATAVIAGTLDITGLGQGEIAKASDIPGQRYTVISTSGGITGNFDTVTIDASSPVDYLTVSGGKSTDGNTYSVGFGLTWLAGQTDGNGVFTLVNADDAFDVDVVLSNQTGPFNSLWDGSTLTKRGDGTLTLSSVNTYAGETLVEAGTLSAGVAQAFAASSAVSVSAGAILSLNTFDQTARNLRGAGTIDLGTADLTVENSAATVFSGVVTGSGSVILDGGQLTLSGVNTYTGGTGIADGILVAANGNALGTGTANIATGAGLQLSFASDETLSNVLAGSGTLTKTGTGVATLDATGSSIGAVSLQTGGLSFMQDGVFRAASYLADAGTVTHIGGDASLQITGNYTQAGGSTLDICIGNNEPTIIAATATITGATLEVSGFEGGMYSKASEVESERYTVIQTSGGITGDFAAVNVGTSADPVDYLVADGFKVGNNYEVGFGLTWNAGAAEGNGVFTIDEDQTFEVDVALENKSASFASLWDGETLTKRGDGTLILSRANTYQGDTLIQEGTLKTGIANAFADSSQVNISAGATLDLNNYNQTAANLIGAGDIILGSAVLTVDSASATTFSGAISGTGSVVKTGSAAFTLSGGNSYTGGTSVATGRLIATTGSSLGSGTATIAGGAELELAVTGDETLTNRLAGDGEFIKSGGGALHLTNASSSVGSVDVQGGTVSLDQNGEFRTTDDYTTRTGATTMIDSNAQLVVGGTFTQESGSVLNVTVGDNQPAVLAGDVSLAGTLNVSGFTADAPMRASELTAQNYLVIQSDTLITGTFDSITVGPAMSPTDFLTVTGIQDNKTYSVGFDLTWFAGSEGNGIFTLTGPADTFIVDRVLTDQAGSATNSWNGKDLTKAGSGTLVLDAVNTYTGSTTVEDGILATDVVNAFADSTEVVVEDGATLDLRGNDQIAQNLTGGGSILLGSGGLTVKNTGSTTFSGVISGDGSLALDGGQLTLSGQNEYTGGTEVQNGTLVASSGDALGSGEVVIKATGSLALDTSGTETFANTLTGDGTLTKTGSGTATLTADNSSVGSVIVSGGTLELAQTGDFEAGSYAIGAGAATSIGEQSTLTVANDFTMTGTSTLSVAIGDNEPIINADTATIGGQLYVTGFDTGISLYASTLLGQTFTIIETTSGLSGTFTDVDLGSASSPVDYLTVSGNQDANKYWVGFGLTWLAGSVNGNGVFTLENPDDSFVVDVVLSDQGPASGTGWDGKTLTKAGDGTLVLAAENTYSGATIIQGGTLEMGIENAIANSSAVTIGADGTLALGDFSQEIKQLSGSGSVTIGDATLTVRNDSPANTVFSGVVSGDGSVALTGGGTLTLSGQNTYAGGTSINAGSTLVATNGNSLGTGLADIDAGSVLRLAFAGNEELANQLAGGGTVEMTGSGTARLTGQGSSVGSVDVQSGTLYLDQSGLFTAGTYTTGANAATTIGTDAKLAVSGTFTQDNDATLNILVGTNTTPMITAADADIGGLLTITGFDASLPASALTARRHTVIDTTGGITGDFDTVDFGGLLTGVDYLILDGSVSDDDKSYTVGFALTWLAGENQGNGVFTLQDAAQTFNVDVVLADQTGPFLSGWNGKDLTKNGDGTLILSATNTYTGSTTVNGGTLSLQADGALGETSALRVNDGAIVAMNDTNQSVGQLFTEAGSTLDLGTGTLTITDTQRDPGNAGGSIAGNTLAGSGTLILDSSDMDVLGANTGYSGDVVADGGSTIAMANGSGLGNGGSLTLTGAGDTLAFQNLGSGAATGILNKDISGLGKVELSDNANIALAGDNSGFSGIFDIESGSTLTASAASQLGTADVQAEGSLVLNSATSWTVDNTVTGTGNFIKTGAGQLSVGDSFTTFAGATEVAEGALIVGTSSTPGAVLGGTGVAIDPDGTMSGIGSVTGPVNNRGTIAALNSLSGYQSTGASNFTVGRLTNQGVINLAGGAVGNTLTVRGGMSGVGGSLIINTVLGGDDSLTDRLILDGGATDGTTDLIVHNAGGVGGQTDVGILVVDAQNGATTTAGAFLLSSLSPGFRDGFGTVVGGAFDYELMRGGNGGESESWYLVSARTARPEAGSYLANREAAESMFSMTMHDRLEGYQIGVDPETGRRILGAAWGRINTSKSSINADGGGLRSRTRNFVMQSGMDIVDCPTRGLGSFRAGVMAGLGWARNRTSGTNGMSSKGHFDGYQLGAYGTWFGDQEGADGWYADGWVTYSWYRNRITGTGLGRQRYNTHMWSASLEAGYAFSVLQTRRSEWAMVPTVQVVYGDYSGSRFTESTGTRIRHADGDRLTTRMGARFKGRVENLGGLPAEPFVEANWVHRSKTGSMAMDGDIVHSDSPKNAYELKVGWEAELRRNLRVGVSVYGQVGQHRFRRYGGQLGLRYEW